MSCAGNNLVARHGGALARLFRQVIEPPRYWKKVNRYADRKGHQPGDSYCRPAGNSFPPGHYVPRTPHDVPH